MVSPLSPSLSAAPDGGCAINRVVSGRAVKPGAAAFSASVVGAVPSWHSLVLGKITLWGAGCRRVPAVSSPSIPSSSAAPGPKQMPGYAVALSSWGWQRATGSAPNPTARKGQIQGGCWAGAQQMLHTLFCRDRGAGRGGGRTQDRWVHAICLLYPRMRSGTCLCHRPLCKHSPQLCTLHWCSAAPCSPTLRRAPSS